MTKEQTAERIKVMQAYVDGKAIQCIDRIGKWGDVAWPDWAEGVAYRVKPVSLGEVARNAYNQSQGNSLPESWQAVADAVVAEFKVRGEQ